MFTAASNTRRCWDWRCRLDQQVDRYAIVLSYVGGTQTPLNQTGEAGQYAPISLGEAHCGAETVEFACTARVYDQGGRVLTCSPDTLLRPERE